MPRVSTQDVLSTEEFDAFVAGLDIPVYVVTVASDDERSGCLIGFTTQVSIDPPQMLVCISQNNHTHRVASTARTMAVHVLAPDQHDIAALFGSETGDHTDKFARCSWMPGPDGVPLLEDCPRRIVGRVVERYRFPDHGGFLLQPVRVEAAPGDGGLTLHDVDDLKPGHPA
jgi:flavin reductase (DIM6/NTAB) family NADH-FMN oxidoreductase RutF